MSRFPRLASRAQSFPRRAEEDWPLELQGRLIPVRLKHSSARRTLALRVDAAGTVTVNAPWGLPKAELMAFVRKHADWLLARLAAAHPGLEWAPGMTLPYLGGVLRLDWRPEQGGSCRLEGDALCLGGPWERVPARVLLWYRARAREVLAPCLARHAGRLGVATPPLRLSDARTRWGSLSPKGVVSLNWRLVKAEPALIDYVVCHELAHLRQRNHSPAFWREVEALLPGHALLRRRLRELGRRYFEF